MINHESRDGYNKKGKNMRNMIELERMKHAKN